MFGCDYSRTHTYTPTNTHTGTGRVNKEVEGVTCRRVCASGPPISFLLIPFLRLLLVYMGGGRGAGAGARLEAVCLCLDSVCVCVCGAYEYVCVCGYRLCPFLMGTAFGVSPCVCQAPRHSRYPYITNHQPYKYQASRMRACRAPG